MPLAGATRSSVGGIGYVVVGEAPYRYFKVVVTANAWDHLVRLFHTAAAHVSSTALILPSPLRSTRPIPHPSSRESRTRYTASSRVTYTLPAISVFQGPPVAAAGMAALAALSWGRAGGGFGGGS